MYLFYFRQFAYRNTLNMHTQMHVNSVHKNSSSGQTGRNKTWK